MITNYKKYLKEKGLRPTYQRIKVLEFLDKNRIHPTPKTVYKRFLKIIPSLSKTTVYNILKDFKDKDIIKTIEFDDGEVRFEINKTPHHHFICRVCGKIYDLKLTCKCFKIGEVAGHKIEEITCYFKGVCAICRKSKK